MTAFTRDPGIIVGLLFAALLGIVFGVCIGVLIWAWFR